MIIGLQISRELIIQGNDCGVKNSLAESLHINLQAYDTADQFEWPTL